MSGVMVLDEVVNLGGRGVACGELCGPSWGVFGADASCALDDDKDEDEAYFEGEEEEYEDDDEFADDGDEFEDEDEELDDDTVDEDDDDL